MVKEIFTPKPLLNLRGELMDLSVPAVMGILNITPDSFYEPSRVGTQQVVERAIAMAKEGADVIDIGAASSRPNADIISEQEELDRLIPVLELLKGEVDLPISIDTYRSAVAKEAVSAGADLINDISGGNLDSEMFSTIASLKVPYVLMHMRGNSQTMGTLTKYNDLLLDIIDDLQKKLHELNRLGVKDVIIDPGFGFAKTLDQNYALLNNLEYFKVLERPVLVGISRKTMLYKLLDTSPENTLNATSVLNTVALSKGAGILRVHDVKEAKEAVILFEKLKHSKI